MAFHKLPQDKAAILEWAAAFPKTSFFGELRAALVIRIHQHSVCLLRPVTKEQQRMQAYAVAAALSACNRPLEMMLVVSPDGRHHHCLLDQWAFWTGSAPKSSVAVLR